AGAEEGRGAARRHGAGVGDAGVHLGPGGAALGVIHDPIVHEAGAAGRDGIPVADRVGVVGVAEAADGRAVRPLERAGLVDVADLAFEAEHEHAELVVAAERAAADGARLVRGRVRAAAGIGGAGPGVDRAIGRARAA